MDVYLNFHKKQRQQNLSKCYYKLKQNLHITPKQQNSNNQNQSSNQNCFHIKKRKCSKSYINRKISIKLIHQYNFKKQKHDENINLLQDKIIQNKINQQNKKSFQKNQKNRHSFQFLQKKSLKQETNIKIKKKNLSINQFVTPKKLQNQPFQSQLQKLKNYHLKQNIKYLKKMATANIRSKLESSCQQRVWPTPLVSFHSSQANNLIKLADKNFPFFQQCKIKQQKQLCKKQQCKKQEKFLLFEKNQEHTFKLRRSLNQNKAKTKLRVTSALYDQKKFKKSILKKEQSNKVVRQQPYQGWQTDSFQIFQDFFIS